MSGVGLFLLVTGNEIMAIKLTEKTESQTCELKTSFGDEALETIGAFANAQGGEIIIGISQDGSICGVTIGKKTLEDWANKIRDATDPRLQPSIQIVQQNNKKIVVIKVEQSSGLPVSIRGKFFKRVGRTNQRMSHEEIMQRLRASTGTTWDAMTVSGASIDDIDFNEVSRFLDIVRKVGRRPIPEKADAQKVLEKMNLIQNGLPTRAALLLFCKNPGRYFPADYIKLGRFRSPTLIVDDSRVEGGILKQFDDCMAWFREKFQTEFIITGKAQRDVKWEYPLDAVREAIVNAICHRDYQINTNIQVRLYDDRLEIWNPGGLPPALSVENLLRDHDSFPRNRLLADCLFYCGIIENWGSGTTRMDSILIDSDFPSPDFRVDSGNRFRVVFRKQLLSKEYLANLGLKESQVQAVLMLKSGQPGITNEEYQNNFSVSKRTASNDLSELVDKGILFKHGVTGKGTRYTLASTKPKGQKGQ